HKRIHHSSGVYVVGETHTNTVEGFWSLVKNGLRGVYHSVGKGYLQSYLNEYRFRYNRRFDVQPMFLSFLGQIEKNEMLLFASCQSWSSLSDSVFPSTNDHIAGD